MNKIKINKIGRILLKVLGWTFAIVFGLIVLVIIALQFPQTQRFLTNKAVTFLENRLQTEVQVGGINVAFPKSVWLQDIYVEDLEQDTLLYCHSLQIDVDMFALLSNEIQLNSIEIEELNSHVYRTLPDSAFNFDFIIEAFEDTTAVQAVDTTSTPWKFSVYGLEIQNTRLRYDDEVSGMNAALKLGQFEVDMDEFDLDSMRFHVDEILLENTVASYVVTKESTSDEAQQDSAATDESQPLDIGLNEIDLANLDLTYENKVVGQKATAIIGKSSLQAEEIQLTDQKIILDYFGLHHSEIAYAQAEISNPQDTLATDSLATSPSDSTSAPLSLDFGWTVHANTIDFTENYLQYDDFNQPTLSEGIDFSHLQVADFGLELNNIALNRGALEVNIDRFQFAEKSGFLLKKLAGILSVDSTNARLSDFEVQTGHSEMRANIHSEYASLASLQTDLGALHIDAEIPASQLALQDLLYFQPSLADSLPLQLRDDFTLQFNTKLEGTVGNLNLDRLELSLLDQTRFSAQGRITGLPEMENAGFNLNSNFQTSNADLAALLPDTLLPASLQIPESIILTTNVQGALADLTTNARLQTDFGNIITDLRLQEVQSDNPAYQGEVKVEQFNLGQLLGKADTIGIVDLAMQADGTGFTPETINAELDGIVNTFEYQQYAYHNLKIDGSIDRKHFTGKASLEDENLAFTFDGDVNMNEEVPAYRFVFDLEKAYLQKLQLAKDDLRLKAKIDADFKFADIDDINGDFGIRDFAVFKNGELYNVDSFLVASVSQTRNTSLEINSDILAAKFEGTLGISSLPATLNQHFNAYYSLHDTTIEKSTEAQNFSFTIDLKQTDLLTEVLLPELGEFNPGEIKGEYDSETRKLAINMNIPVIQYANFNMDSLALNVDSDQEKLTYELKIAEVTDSTFTIDNFSVDGKVQNDSISTALIIQDSTYQDKYRLAGTFTSQENNYEFHFQPEGVLLNYELWNLPQQHSLQFGETGFTAEEFVLKREQQQITLTSENKKLNIDFKDFQLATLSAMIERNQEILRGMLNGGVQLDNQQEAMAFNTDLNIEDFTYLEDTVGNIALQANNPQSNRYDVSVDISGFGNDAKINGYYLSDSLNPELDFDVALNKLNLASIEAFTAGQLENAEGYISGEMLVNGSPAAPNIQGNLNFNQTKFEATYLGTALAIDNQSIAFNREEVQFNDFTIADSENQNLIVDGIVDISDLSNLGLNLIITSDQFLALNTTEEDNDLYYGKLLLNSNIEITGKTSELQVAMDLEIGDESSLTYVVPASETGSTEQEGIVRFVDKDKAGDDFFADIENENPGDTLRSPLGMDLNANISVTNNSRFQVIIDPASGDNLVVQGDADLSLGINPAGDISLTGQYEVAEGQYNLSFYSIVKREFSVKEGSRLVWSGDVLNAQVDLTAVYELETAPIELMQNQVVDETQLNVYKQKLPFIVNLHMQGELLKPDITFSLDMEDDAKGFASGTVYGKIQAINQEEAQLNKQVFSLLILQRFMADNPFASSSGSTEGAVRSSVSKILSDQLDKLTDQIEGIDIDIGLKSYEDYSTGEAQGRTDLNLGLSKQFLNDRIIIKVAGNINLEGSEQQRNLSDFAGDVSLEYKLTEDGRFRLITFRKEVYEELLQGEIIETGAGFIIIKDFDKFKEIFRKNREENWNETDDGVSKK